jgi:tRNA uridine 5-carbamoylmethylation protein Kti12
MRFEEPNPNQRWDSPLFVIQPDDILPFKNIEDAIFNRKPPPPNMATQNVSKKIVSVNIADSSWKISEISFIMYANSKG